MTHTNFHGGHILAHAKVISDERFAFAPYVVIDFSAGAGLGSVSIFPENGREAMGAFALSLEEAAAVLREHIATLTPPTLPTSKTSDEVLL